MHHWKRKNDCEPDKRNIFLLMTCCQVAQEKKKKKDTAKFTIVHAIRMRQETITIHTIGTRIPLLTFGNMASLSLSCAIIISLRSTIFNPSQGRTTLLHKITIYYTLDKDDAFKQS